MPRAIWKGAVSFGLVSIPVKLYGATEEKDVRFHQVHAADGGRIRYKRVCQIDGEEVAYSEIAKGYELETGETVILTDTDLAELPLSASREIEVLEFVPADQLDPILFAKTYYLEPEGSAVKPYVLLREALESTERMAVVKVALRQREAMAALRVRDGVIVLQTMLWPDEIRTPEFAFLDDDVELRPQERQMAASLVESMAADFDSDEFHDEYREALLQLIDAKTEGAVTVASTDEGDESGGEVVDLMTALKASVDRARSRRTGESTPAPKKKTAEPAKKTAEKKPAAKKAAPRKRKTA
ncbi:Ku protein [Fodinicola acaciae]|uniref:non-homologous end joining protein Ku n=1 Tax=Fodinicola acaciae TaxID=2681555 RepID=UPI0013D7195D|nr:Ku protein [Fodinicola acaciae]